MTEENKTATAPRKVAFLGLGVMGFPMAGHLVRAGHDVTVYNRTAAKAQLWAQTYGGKTAATPRGAAAGCDIVFACVGQDKDLRQVVLGEEGALAGMRPGAVFVDHTTDSAEVAREMAALFAGRGMAFVDAPVSGGQAGAENGVLTVMCGSDTASFDAVKDVIAAYACSVTRIGGAGCGQLAKMVNQICIAGVVQGLSEAVAFGLNAGLDMKLVLPVLEKGAAGSWQMKARGATMVDNRFDFGFAVDWMRKDLAIALAEARKNGSSLPVTALVNEFYADVQRAGGSRWDTSSLVTRLPRPCAPKTKDCKD